ncbi:MAG: xanthine dehydrogenase family protein molybdopterin-binding subunit [Immundisolibacteraceae bacterium]|nr:xanthine dehydrogenase family protein molybdopterin-binding subunit [Immundisolibacteraceae bacterium]
MNSPKSDLPNYKYVGTRSIRPDGVDKVTGRAQFGADVSLPNMVHGQVLRSTIAHGRIRSINIDKAMAVDGVLAIITAADMPDIERRMVPLGEQQADIRDVADNVMARDKVLYHGQPVAAIAATSLAAGAQALELIEVDYEPLPVVIDLDAAQADNATLLHDEQITMTMAGPVENPVPTNVAFYMPLAKGDVAAGFEQADVIVENSFETATVHQGYIEPHATLVDAQIDGRTRVWTSTQGPFLFRTLIAGVLDISVSELQVIPTEIGGGFGGKLSVYLEPLAVVLSRRCSRPVKMVMSREDVLRASGPASASRIWVKIGARYDGTLVAIQAKLEFEAGAFKGSPVVPAVMTMFASYKMEHLLLEGYDVVVNKPKASAYRAPGAPQAAFAGEALLDELALKLNMDPIDLRLKNAVDEGDRAVYGPAFGPIGLKQALQAVKSHSWYDAPLAANQGRGMAVGFWFNVGMQSSASVRINEDGAVTVVTGSVDVGGSRASMALFAAEELGVPPEKIQALVGNTKTIGYCDTTGGSRTTFATGLAVVEASRKAVIELRNRAAMTWELDVEQVSWQNGQAIDLSGSNPPLALAEITAKAGHTGGPVGGDAQINAPHAGPGFGVQLCDVEVDPETGYTKILRYLVVQDVGKAIHPSYVEGQLQGGAVQGIGMSLNEEYLYNADGVLDDPGFLDYRVPVASDVPMIETHLIEVPHPPHPYGVRGVGETPIVPPMAAVTSAISHAIGKRVTQVPMSPPRLLSLIDGD